jgi:hypothetical protein
MSSKQIKLLCLILGCVTLVCVAGVLYPGYRFVEIVKDYGIDAPFEDFTTSKVMTDILYAIDHAVEGLWRLVP